MPRLPTRILGSILLTLLGSASAASLTLRATPVVPGEVPLFDARWDTREGVHLCFGDRLVSVSAQGQVAGIALGGSCRALSISPDLTRAAALVGDRLVLLDLGSRSVTATQSVPGLSGAGFRADGALLVGSAAGLERVSVPDLSRQLLDATPVTTLALSTDGTRAVVVRGARVQLLDSATLQVLSGTNCDAPCPAGRVTFSADGRSVIVRSGGTLLALREGFPATTVLRASDPEATADASGLPLRNNTALILRAGEWQVRDIQTGHRELSRAQSGLRATPASLSPQEQLLSLSGATLTTSGPGLTDARTLLRLPGRVRGGAVDAAGTLVTLGVDGLLRTPQVSRALAVQGANRSAYALLPGGLVELRGPQQRKLPAQRGATGLSVNHWGNHVASWSATGLSVTSQKSGTVVFTAPLAGLNRVTVAPDGTRAYLFPSRGEPRVLLLSSRKTFPLPVRPGASYRDVQISGKGTFAYARTDGRTDLYLPGQRQPTATLNGAAAARFSPDSTVLAVGTATPGGWVVTVHDAATGRELTRSEPLDSTPAFIAWSADSRELHAGAGPLHGLGSVSSFTFRP